ncbi:AMP-binding protein [Aminobacter sp. SR38]|jgi:acyl-CoA synthetase (AMP-forming)/AMP-acid ligase II|uniref:AMP-binding protein n=1 Tax=Aminobacter sp. SR38 TaxID=2774562 RepID=UPI001781D947|nr:AMP-binding protein [Aminobacter sp. SR38]QOF70680.1 AMP-binding protein [Aminobacter sp. SR38]
MDFLQRLASYGERTALVFPGRPTISYAELARRVTVTAAGFGAGRKLVALEASNSEHAIIAYLAARAGGHVVALVAPGDAQAFDAFEEDFRPDVCVRQLDGRWRLVEGEGAGETLHADLAVLLATSGSTGRSRFVRLSRTNVESNARAIACYLGLAPADRAALILPFHYSYGLSVLNSHLAVGASVFVSAKGVADKGFVDDLRAAAVSNISGVPYSYQLMDKTGFSAEELPSLRFMTVAGGRMPAGLAETVRRRLEAKGRQLFLMYGQTEATARIAYVPPAALADNPDSIGIGIPGGELALVHEDGGRIDGCGEAGELVYRGPNVMMGYALDRNDLARGAEIGELSTGDLAERCENGFFRVVGRLKRMSKIAGLRISHEAVEHALASRGVVAAVTGDDRRLVAAFSSGEAPEDVCKLMIEASGLTALHVEAVAVDTLPRLASGKVDHQAMAQLARRNQKADAGLIEAFGRAFYPRRVTPADSFEELGGDSLLYVQLSLTLERKLGRIPEGWEKMPVGALARLSSQKGNRRIVDTDMLMRALAILLVVLHHATLWPIPGGAAALVMLVGYGLARFHGAALMRGETSRLLRAVAANLAVYAPLVVGFSIARGEVLWPSVFLVGNLGIFDPKHMLPYLYWFVEAYAQVMLIVAVLFSLPAVRKQVAARPFATGMTALVVTIAIKILAPKVWAVGAVQIFTVSDVFYLAVFGWCAFHAQTARQRMAVLGMATMAFPFMAYWGGNWTGSWVKFMLQLACVAMLLYVPRITVPRQVAALALPVAAAGYHIYLFHRLVPELVLPQLQLPWPVLTTLSVVTGVLTGVAVFHSQKALTAWLASRRGHGAVLEVQAAPAE